MSAGPELPSNAEGALGKTDLTEERGRKLLAHLEHLDAHPEIPPSPPEVTSIKVELEKRRRRPAGAE